MTILDSICSVSSDCDLLWSPSIPRIAKMSTLRHQCPKSHCHLYYHHSMLMLLVMILQNCAGATEMYYEYHHVRHYIKVPGNSQLHMSPSHRITYSQTPPNITYPSRSGAQACVPIGNYHGGTMGYAVCNTAPSQTYVRNIARDVILNKTYSLHASFFDNHPVGQIIFAFSSAWASPSKFWTGIMISVFMTWRPLHVQNFPLPA